MEEKPHEQDRSLNFTLTGLTFTLSPSINRTPILTSLTAIVTRNTACVALGLDRARGTHARLRAHADHKSIVVKTACMNPMSICCITRTATAWYRNEKVPRAQILRPRATLKRGAPEISPSAGGGRWPYAVSSASRAADERTHAPTIT